MAIRWDSEADWKDNQDSSGTTGRNGELKQGYSRDKPPLSQDLVGYWPLHDENATDYSGNDNHGSLNGGVTTGVAGKGGLQAMSFDGSDDWIDIPNQLLSNGSSLTLSFWFKAGALGSDDRPVAISQSHECLANIGRSGSNEIGVRWRAGDGNARDYGFQSISSNKWCHYTVTYDSSTGDLKGYLNATEQLNKPGIGSSGISQASAIGQKGSKGYYNGKISDIRLYSRALTPSEIQNLYEWGSGNYARPPNDGVSYYKLNGDATDSWGSNDGTNNGVNFVSDAVRNQSGDFVSSESDWIDCGNPSIGTIPYTFSSWVKWNGASSFQMGVHYSNSADGDESGFGINSDGTIRLFDGDTQLVNSNTSLSTGKWYHVTGIVEGSSGNHIYINGVKDASSTTSYAPSAGVDGLALGDNADSGIEQHLNGQLDDVRIYNRTLKAHEIHEIYRYGTRGRDMRKFLANQ